MKSKIIAIVVACVLLVSAGGYLVYQQFLNQFSLEFSEYYQQAEDFEELEPLLNQYFGAVQAAYDRSDKENLETFVLDDSYEEVEAILSKKQKNHSDKFAEIVTLSPYEQEPYMAALKLYRLYLKVGLLISERDLIVISNTSDSIYNPEWFAELDASLLDVYDECANGNGEF